MIQKNMNIFKRIAFNFPSPEFYSRRNTHTYTQLPSPPQFFLLQRFAGQSNFPTVVPPQNYIYTSLLD